MHQCTETQNPGSSIAVTNVAVSIEMVRVNGRMTLTIVADGRWRLLMVVDVNCLSWDCWSLMKAYDGAWLLRRSVMVPDCQLWFRKCKAWCFTMVYNERWWLMKVNDTCWSLMMTRVWTIVGHGWFWLFIDNGGWWWVLIVGIVDDVQRCLTTSIHQWWWRLLLAHCGWWLLLMVIDCCQCRLQMNVLEQSTCSWPSIMLDSGQMATAMLAKESVFAMRRWTPIIIYWHWQPEG